MSKAKPYIIGFGISLVLTLTSFYFVWSHVSSKHEMYSHIFLVVLVLVLALMQFLVQLFTFMGTELKQKWNFVMILSAVGLVFIVVTGSIWIMYHLNNNMTPKQVEQYVESQDGF